VSRPARPGHYAKPRFLLESERVLPTVWALHDCPDVELMCRGVMAEVRPRDPLTWVEEEDVLAFLFEHVAILDKRYRPAEHPGILFRPWAYSHLRFRLRDHYRSVYGRRGEKRRPDSLDAPAFADSGVTGADRLGRLIAAGAGDRDDLRALDLRRSLARRSRDVFREVSSLGGRADEGAAPRDRSTARAAWLTA
jgi:hypothetical protein